VDIGGRQWVVSRARDTRRKSVGKSDNCPGTMGALPYTSEALPQTDEIYATQKLDSIATSSHVQDI